jgi:hypothetical protein
MRCKSLGHLSSVGCPDGVDEVGDTDVGVKSWRYG